MNILESQIPRSSPSASSENHIQGAISLMPESPGSVAATATRKAPAIPDIRFLVEPAKTVLICSTWIRLFLLDTANGPSGDGYSSYPVLRLAVRHNHCTTVPSRVTPESTITWQVWPTGNTPDSW